MSIKGLVKQVLTEKENKRYEKRLADSKVSYADWLREQERCWRGEGCEDGVGGDNDFVLICAADGKLTDYARKSIARYFNENSDAFVVYGDEDVLDADGKADLPWFKPDWSPDFLDSCLYFGSLVAVRREHWQKLRENYEAVYPGRWQQLFGPKDEEEFYRVTDLDAYERWLHDCVSGGYEKGSRSVAHIPQILFRAQSEKMQRRFLEKSDYLHARRQGLLTGFFENFADVESAHKPVVSVIIPSKDQPDILRQCVEGVRTACADIPCEILLVDNGSRPENKAKIESMIQEAGCLKMNGRELPIRYFYEPMEFNFSRMCNMGAKEAKGELLLFLNDDVVLGDECVGEMAARAARAYTGAVGIKLLYPDSGRIQHAGIMNLPMGPVHKLQFQADDKDYYGKANHSCRNFLAVTAACLMVEAEKFREAGGFSEELRVAFNDVDLCFRLYELGYYNVCVNDLNAWHHESLSRGADESPEKLARLLEEREKLYRSHPMLESLDPYYSIYLNREGLDTLIRPAYETAGNQLQKAEGFLKPTDISNCRQDECLMVRVEDCRGRKMTGYSVVLGDNNACYEKVLLLESGTGTEGRVFGLTAEGQYRPDLEENLPDQTNVAMSGFSVELGAEAVPKGNYRIGMMARNRITGGRLVNWSNRFVEL